MSQHILIAEDEPRLAQLVADYLTAEGFTSEIIYRGDEVLAAVEAQQPAALLQDIMMPGLDGISILKTLRQTSDLPVLMITAKVEEIDRILGLELGADDYICKPFSPREVIARLKTVLRRAQPQAGVGSGRGDGTELDRDVMVLDAQRYECRYHDIAVELSAIEFQLLQRMSKEPGRIFSRQQLMTAMYSDHRVVNDRTIDSHVKKLRKKLAEYFPATQFIHSIYAVGYRYEISSDDAPQNDS